MAKKDKGYKSALENLIEDKGLDSAIVIEALTEALAKSYKKNYSGAESIVDCKIDDDGKNTYIPYLPYIILLPYHSDCDKPNFTILLPPSFQSSKKTS